MPKLADSRSIELKCSLCPKSPTFSDVSHLLTHISSKSHLAHRFKLQIRAGCELEAKSQLEEFDYWYHTNDLGTLLSKRMAAKEEKKNGKEKKSRKVSAILSTLILISESEFLRSDIKCCRSKTKRSVPKNLRLLTPQNIGLQFLKCIFGPHRHILKSFL